MVGNKMGFYAKHVLPTLIDLTMRNREVARLRAEWLPRARGDVLDVGIGSGLNLAFYTSQVQHVFGVDPSAELQAMARKRSATLPPKVDFLLQPAESPLPIGDATIDTVVVTWTLCTMPNPLQALAEMKRVLKKDGALLFLEHGRSPDAAVVRWQDRLTPLWRRVSGGCHLNRKIDGLIEGAGFHIAEIETGYLPGPRAMTYMYKGLAQLR